MYICIYVHVFPLKGKRICKKGMYVKGFVIQMDYVLYGLSLEHT